MCVLVIVFCGAFSCFVSADSSTSQRLFDLYERYWRSVGEFIWDQTIFADYERLKQFLGEQKDAIEEQQGNTDGLRLYYAYNQKYYDFDVLGYSESNQSLKCCSLFCVVDNFHTESFSTRSNLGNAYVCAVPAQYARYVSFSFDGTYYRLIASESIVYYDYTLKLGVDNDDNPYTYVYRSPAAHNVSGGNFYTNNITPNPDPSWFGRRLGINDFDRTKIDFFGSSDLDGDILHLDLTSSREIVESVDGTFLLSSGILYDDGSDRMYAGEYTNFQNAASGDYWSWDYDLNGLSYYLYRKRCPLENYKAYIFVYQNGFLYNVEFPIELEPPGGIFDDIDDPPDWKDFEPEPSEPPEPPVFEGDRIFNYTSSVNNYHSFTWTTINNYSISGSGGGAGGGGDSSSGSGGDSSSGSGDDSSSGGDSSSGSDPGCDGSFNDWFFDAVVTINTNVNNGLDTINDNIRIIKENTENFFEAVHDYIEGYFHDWLEYIAALLEKFRDDFNAWTSAFGVYLDDCFDTLNHNIVVVGDNIVKAIKTQVVPDKDVLYDIASSNFPIVDQVNTSLSDFDVEDKSLIVSIPLFGSHEEPAAYFVNQSFNSDGQLRGSDSGESISINYLSGDCLTFNLTDIFTRYDIPRFRSVGSLFILGSTFWSLINITFKIFGLGFFRDVQLYGGALE